MVKDGIAFKSSDLMTLNGSLNSLSVFNGRSSTALQLYLICPYLPSKDDGKLSGSMHAKEYVVVPATRSRFGPDSVPNKYVTWFK
jgi:hypothetical protein